MAYALASSGKRVLLLERGGVLPRERENWDPDLIYGPEERYKTRERWTDASDGSDFRASMYYHVGGNTKAYGSAMLRARPEDLDDHPTADGVAPGWPISYDDLRPHYARAERVYRVHGRRGADPFEPPADGPYPHPALAHDPRIAEVAEGLRGVGVRAFELPMAVRLNPEGDDRGPFVLREAFAARGAETFDGYPDLTGLKADAETATVRPALAHPNVELRTGARVTRLVPTPDGREVAHVEAEVAGPDGAAHAERFSGDVVVLAAGAVNSAALLLRSASEHHPDGLANVSGQVGRNLMRHVTTKFYAVAPGRPNDTFFQKTLAVNDYYFGGPDGGPPLGHAHLMGKHTAMMIARDLGISAEEAAPIARDSVDWWIQTEDLPLPESRVTVGRDGRIAVRWVPSNVAPHERLMDVLEERLRRIGFERFLRVPMPLRVMNHQCGTCRMGADPATSVLDAHCRAHEVQNLYVADASCFPSSGATNPTLTIVANAFRVAERIGRSS